MKTQDWLECIFQQAPVAIALLEGSDYRIKLANPTMYEIWQLLPQHQSVIGRPLFEVLPTIADVGLAELLAEVRRTKQSIKGLDIPYRKKDNHRAYLNFVYAPIDDGQGNTNIVMIATDVTSQVLTRQDLADSENQFLQQSKALVTSNQDLAVANQRLAINNRDLETANSQLSRSNSALEQFAYVASHDLQEPLRKIQQFGDIVQSRFSEQLGAEGAQYVERMQLAATRMSTLIKDLLTYSRLSTRQDAAEAVNLTNVVQEAVANLELLISETGALIQVGSLPTLQGQYTQFVQLFQNLIGNAIKFRQSSVPCQVSISSRVIMAAELAQVVKPVRPTDHYHVISVADNGIGFDEQYLSRIFQVFQRLHSRGEYVGTGVGLAVCEKVATNHGGAITATSQLGKGATFYVCLPVE